MKTQDPSSACSVWVASDHAGFELKNCILRSLRTSDYSDGYTIFDGGPHHADRVDYPDLAWPITLEVAQALDQGHVARGILVCGTGIGVSLVANRHPAIRAALAHDLFTAEMARRHNDAQILCIGARVVASDLALDMVKLFLTSPFDGGRHADRVDLLQALNHS